MDSDDQQAERDKIKQAFEAAGCDENGFVADKDKLVDELRKAGIVARCEICDRTEEEAGELLQTAVPHAPVSYARCVECAEQRRIPGWLEAKYRRQERRANEWWERCMRQLEEEDDARLREEIAIYDE